MLLSSYFWFVSMNLFPIRFSFSFPTQSTRQPERTLADRTLAAGCCPGTVCHGQPLQGLASSMLCHLPHSASLSNTFVKIFQIKVQNSNKFVKEREKLQRQIEMKSRRRSISSKALKGWDHHFLLWKSACFHIIFNNPL